MSFPTVSSTIIDGVWVVGSPPAVDERGHFERLFYDKDFALLGLSSPVSQCAVSYNRTRGTLRGMHYQLSPHSEAKLVRCLKGAIYDVALDLRESSPTYGRSVGMELRDDAHRALYVPAGCAHGFLTLTDDASVLYCIFGPYSPEAARVVRWNDPAFAIEWPFGPGVMSVRDREAPNHRLV